MLILKEEYVCTDISIDIDEYVPFTVEVNTPETSSPPLYWRGGDGKSSLIEIGLTRESGSVCSVTLTTINPNKVKETKLPIDAGLPEVSGMPVFDTSTWDSGSDNYSDNFQDEFGSEIGLILGENYLTLQFESVDKSVRYVKNNQLRFGIASNGMLSTLDIVGLTTDEINMLKPI